MHGSWKHLQLKMGILAAKLIAATSLGYAQGDDSSARRVSACEVPNAKNTLSNWSDFERYQEDALCSNPLAGQKRVVF